MQIAAIVAACALAALFVIVVVRPPPSGWLFCDVRENRCYAHNLCFYRETRGDVIKMGMAGLRLPEAVRGVGALPIWTMLYWRDTYPFYAAWVGGPYMSRGSAQGLLLVR